MSKEQPEEDKCSSLTVDSLYTDDSLNTFDKYDSVKAKHFATK